MLAQQPRNPKGAGFLNFSAKQCRGADPRKRENCTRSSEIARGAGPQHFFASNAELTTLANTPSPE
jgi:hypothetical protein